MKVVIVLLIVSLFLLSGCVSNTLPDSFTIDMTRDTTSSGATRITNAELVFENGIVVNGEYSYFVSGTGGPEYEINCEVNVENLEWIPADETSDCNSVSIPLTKEGLQEEIDSGEYVEVSELSECRHRKLCYTLS